MVTATTGLRRIPNPLWKNWQRLLRKVSGFFRRPDSDATFPNLRLLLTDHLLGTCGAHSAIRWRVGLDHFNDRLDHFGWFMLTVKFPHRPALDHALALCPSLVHALHAGIVEAGAIGARVHRDDLHPIKLQFLSTLYLPTLHSQAAISPLRIATRIACAVVATPRRLRMRRR